MILLLVIRGALLDQLVINCAYECAYTLPEMTQLPAR